jgi:hypothetical protein
MNVHSNATVLHKSMTPAEHPALPAEGAAVAHGHAHRARAAAPRGRAPLFSLVAAGATTRLLLAAGLATCMWLGVRWALG